MPLESLIPVLPDHEVGARLAEGYLTYSQRRGKWGRVEVCCGTAQSGKVYTLVELHLAGGSLKLEACFMHVAGSASFLLSVAFLLTVAYCSVV